MTAFPQAKAPIQPQTTATLTAKPSDLEAAAAAAAAASTANRGGGRPSTRAQSKSRPAKARQEPYLSDLKSNTAALSLIRRVLLPDKAQSDGPDLSRATAEEALPPLSSSNDVDIQLYAIVAIILKEFVNTWYTKITPDRTFNEEIVQIIAHCTRALEQRLRCIDLVEVLFDELPVLIARHVNAYRQARSESEQYLYSSDIHQIYHQQNAHPALQPVPIPSDQSQNNIEQQQNENIYRQLLVNGALAVLLPPEDLQNVPLRILVADILADLITGQALASKVCQGWFLHDAFIKTISVIKNQTNVEAAGETQIGTTAQLEKFGLLSSNPDTKGSLSSKKQRRNLISWFWRVMQSVYLLVVSIRFVFRGLSRARSSHSRLHSHTSGNQSPIESKQALDNFQPGRPTQPVLLYSVYGAFATLIRLQDRMPWLQSMLAFWQCVLTSGIGQLASVDSVLDKFLHETISLYLLPSSLLPQVLLAARINLFPNNSLGPPAPPPPSVEAQVEIRRKAAESILSMIPPMVARKYFACDDEEDMIEQISEDILDCFSDTYMNKHLVYGIVELILVRLIPELSCSSITDLLAERGVFLGDDNNSVLGIGSREQ